MHIEAFETSRGEAMLHRVWSSVLGIIVVLPGGAFAQKGTKSSQTPAPIDVKVPIRKEPVSYSRELVDMLEEKCVGCHGSVLAESKLSLEGVPTMLKGGKHGPAIVPGKADESLLFRMAAHRVEPFMPPEDKPGNPPLSPEELGLLKLWIDAGAKDDSDEQPPGKRREAHAVVLGELPPGVQPINAIDMTADGARIAAGRANVVQVYDVDSGLEIISLGGHKDLIQSVRFSPDGSKLAAGSYQIVSLWTVPSGGLRKTLAGHGGPVTALAVSADGNRAYSGGQDKTIRCWSLAEGKQEWTISQPSPVHTLAIGPAGTTLLSGGADGLVRVLDASDHKELTQLKGHQGAVEALIVLRPGGARYRLVSVSADGTGRIWSLPVSLSSSSAGNDASKLSESAPIVLGGQRGPVRAVAVTADARLAIMAGDDKMLQLWDTNDGKLKRTLTTTHSGPILALVVSPDGKTLATGSADKTVNLLSIESGRTIRTLKGHAGAVQALAFSRDGTRLATAGGEGGIKVWEASTGRGLIAFGHMAPGGGAIQPVRRVAFTADGELLSASADSTLKTWSFTGAWTELRTFGPHQDRVLSLDFSPDATLLAAGGGEPSRSGEVKIWELGKGLLGRSLDTLHSDTVFALRFSPDGTRLASASADRFLKVTQVSDGKELRSFEGHTHHVMAIDWKSDGKQLVTGGADKVLKLWDFESGEQVRTFSEAGKQITSARWIAGKPQVVAASGDAQVRIWSSDDGSVLRSFGGPGDFVYCVSASSDGSRIAAGGAESVLFIWNGQNGQVMRKIEPPARTSLQASHHISAAP
jgi:WD40 repeat protein